MAAAQVDAATSIQRRLQLAAAAGQGRGYDWSMVFDLDRKYLAAAAAMLVGLAALVATSLQAPTQLRSDVADVDRGRDLRMQVQDLHVSLLNLESSERGYLLSQDAAYLKPFHSDLARLDEQLAALSSATATTDATELT
ncbi:MAG: CHASE3 domain-containing protein, partial [Leptothrix sp. (in: b-proteobacteria)]